MFKLMAKKIIIFTKKFAKSGPLLYKCLFQIVRHGGCLGLGLAAMGTARQGELQESLCKIVTLKKTKNWFSRLIMA